MIDNGIVKLTFKEANTPVDPADAKGIYQARNERLPDVKQLLLLDITNNPKPGKEARGYANNDDLRSINKAIMMGNAFGRILGNFFRGLNLLAEELQMKMVEKGALQQKNKALIEHAYIASHDLRASIRLIYTPSSFVIEDNEDSIGRASK